MNPLQMLTFSIAVMDDPDTTAHCSSACRAAEAEMLKCWRLGSNTYDIALRLGVDEHVVANRLPRILATERGKHCT